MINKDFLKQHFEMINEYQQEVQRLEEYKYGAHMQSTANIDGMPRATGMHSDKTALWVVQKELLEENVAEMQCALNEHERQIENVVRKLGRAKEKTVIRLRYINGLSWDEITFFFYGDENDYCEQVEWYKLKVQRVHGTALKNMLKIQQNNS